MFVCVYVCIRVSIYECVCVYVYVCMHVYVCVYVFVCVYEAGMCVFVYVYVYVCMCISVYVCVYRAFLTNVTQHFEMLYLSEEKRSADILDGGDDYDDSLNLRRRILCTDSWRPS